ncbi:MAG: DUF3084 domain-containing protein [Candidatus Rifleibacteriota bacterium]
MSYVIILMLVSGIIAYIGDLLGTYVGKRRLTVFGLRPRVTALIVAISTGILITVFTLGVAATLSEDVKIALFSVERLKEEKNKLEKETSILKIEKNSLEEEKRILAEDVERLKTIVRIKETESVVFRKDEPLAAIVIKAGNPEKEIMKELTDLIITLSDRARKRGVKVQDEISFFTENKEQLSKMASYIASSTQDLVVAAVAAENVNAGENLGNVKFMLQPNNLIFTKNMEIASIEIDGRKDRGMIARTLKEFIDEINLEVTKRGMIANPLTKRFGDLSSDSMISFYDMVNRIKALNRPIVLIAVVPEDTYAIGPLNVNFSFEETGENIYSTLPDQLNGTIASNSSSTEVLNQ